MSEMAQTADHIIVLGRGRIVADAPVNEILANASGGSVKVRTPQIARLGPLLESEGAAATATAPDLLSVTGIAAQRVGEIAASAGVVLYELTPLTGSLEDAYMELTRDSIEYATADYDTPTTAEANR